MIVNVITGTFVRRRDKCEFTFTATLRFPDVVSRGEGEMTIGERTFQITHASKTSRECTFDARPSDSVEIFTVTMSRQDMDTWQGFVTEKGEGGRIACTISESEE